MRTFALQFLGASLALSLLGVSSALAAGMSPKSEPVSVFMKGPNLEWSSVHAYGKASPAEHREYHKNAEAERVLWLRDHASALGSEEYRDAERDFVQKRNLMHRQWHLKQLGWVQTDAAKDDASVKFFDAEFTNTTISAPQGEHVYFGIPPSRRSLVNQTRKQQTLHSLTIGQ